MCPPEGDAATNLRGAVIQGATTRAVPPSKSEAPAAPQAAPSPGFKFSEPGPEADNATDPIAALKQARAEALHYQGVLDRAEADKEAAARLKTPEGARRWNKANDDAVEAIRGLRIASARVKEMDDAAKAAEEQAKEQATAAKEDAEWEAQARALETLPAFQALPDEGKNVARALVKDRLATAVGSLSASKAPEVEQPKPTNAEKGEGLAEQDDAKARAQGVPTDADKVRAEAAEKASEPERKARAGYENWFRSHPKATDEEKRAAADSFLREFGILR